MAVPGAEGRPEGVGSILDTDLYKLTMANVVWKDFPDIEVTYSFTNRTSHMRLTRQAYDWISEQIEKLQNLALTQDEYDYLKKTCTYLDDGFLAYLQKLRLKSDKHIQLSFHSEETIGEQEFGDVNLVITGLWVETILFEIPLLALISEAYFKFCDTDWSHDGQEENAYQKGVELLKNGCFFSEFGSRRRRDYATHDTILQGLLRAAKEGASKGLPGRLTGTSNVHFAMKNGLIPIGTVAHEWFMGVAAVTDSYETANELALRYWVDCFGEGVLGIALTDTFGTPSFLKAFRQQVPVSTRAKRQQTASPEANPDPSQKASVTLKTYAQVFNGVRQDSGDPLEFVKIMRSFYDEENIKDKGEKTIVFSDALNVDLCIKYKKAAEDSGFQASFGIGTFLTNDFKNTKSGSKSVPLNIVIKLSSAAGNPAVKISDNMGKNTGDKATVERAKRDLGYVEKSWSGGDEKSRWDSKK